MPTTKSRGPQGFKRWRCCSCPEEFVVAANPWLRDEPRFHDTLPLSKSFPTAKLLFWNLLVPLLQLCTPGLSPSFSHRCGAWCFTDEGLVPPGAAWGLLRHPAPKPGCLTAPRKSPSASSWVGQWDMAFKTSAFTEGLILFLCNHGHHVFLTKSVHSGRRMRCLLEKLCSLC